VAAALAFDRRGSGAMSELKARDVCVGGCIEGGVDECGQLGELLGGRGAGAAAAVNGSDYGGAIVLAGEYVGYIHEVSELVINHMSLVGEEVMFGLISAARVLVVTLFSLPELRICSRWQLSLSLLKATQSPRALGAGWCGRCSCRSSP
jgi:hypothetical protein